jgi:putative SOS response-associated peptidase YedK
MPSPDTSLSDQQREALFAALLSRGWHWRDGSIYAPHGTMWLLGTQPWRGDLRDFHARMTGRLRRNQMARWMYERESDHQNLVSDTRSLVQVLADLLSTPNA